MQDELRFAPASREAAGPYFPVGAAARLQNRATHDPTSTALNLAHSLCGFSQLAALQVRAPSRHGRTASLQHMHSRPELKILPAGAWPVPYAVRPCSCGFLS